MINRKKPAGFSLVELVIVIVIIGVIAAIAVPRISRGAAGAGEAALRGDLYVLRNAIDLYAAEHGGLYPSSTDATFKSQMTGYTDEAGTVSPTGVKVDPYNFGPYLVKVPTLKVGSGLNNGKGKDVVGASAGAGIAWVYDSIKGTIVPNSVDAVDDAGVKYAQY